MIFIVPISIAFVIAALIAIMAKPELVPWFEGVIDNMVSFIKDLYHNFSIEDISKKPIHNAGYDFRHQFRLPNEQTNDISLVYVDFYEKTNIVTEVIELNAKM